MPVRSCVSPSASVTALPNARPYIPTGAAYATSGWSPTAAEIIDFLNTAKALGLPAVNFYQLGCLPP